LISTGDHIWLKELGDHVLESSHCKLVLDLYGPAPAWTREGEPSTALEAQLGYSIFGGDATDACWWMLMLIPPSGTVWVRPGAADGAAKRGWTALQSA